jgi:hypothetical protein
MQSMKSGSASTCATPTASTAAGFRFPSGNIRGPHRGGPDRYDLQVNQVDPTQDHLADFCRRELPVLLAGACTAPASLIEQVSVDVLGRARALSKLDPWYWEVLAAPFLEESFHHRPPTVSAHLKALTTVVVRNSKLEDLHVHWGLEAAAVTAITTRAGEILDRWLPAGSRPAASPGEPNPLRALDQTYPLAWKSLERLANLADGGGHLTYEVPPVERPALPGSDERFEARRSTSVANGVVVSGIEARFDHGLIRLMSAVAAGTHPVVLVSALSRFSRDWGKMARVLEFCLAHGSTVLTTNYLLDNGKVWVRYGDPVQPDSYDPLAGLRHLQGLSEHHLTTVLEILKENHVTPHRPPVIATRAKTRRQRR